MVEPETHKNSGLAGPFDVPIQQAVGWTICRHLLSLVDIARVVFSPSLGPLSMAFCGSYVGSYADVKTLNIVL